MRILRLVRAALAFPFAALGVASLYVAGLIGGDDLIDSWDR